MANDCLSERPKIEGDDPPALLHSNWDCSSETGYMLGRYEALRILASLGPVVYAVAYGPWVKIGWTGNIVKRVYSLDTAARRDGFGPCELLGFTFGTRDDEAAVHCLLVAHLARGREYFHPADEVMAVVNSWRTDLGLAAA